MPEKKVLSNIEKTIQDDINFKKPIDPKIVLHRGFTKAVDSPSTKDSPYKSRYWFQIIIAFLILF